jgi:hypothetical protein
MPLGRLPIETHILLPSQREQAYQLVEKEVEFGHQAFIIYPLVENEEEELNDFGLWYDEYLKGRQSSDEDYGEYQKRLENERLNEYIEAGQIAISTAKDIAFQIADAKIEALDYEIEESRRRQDEILKLIEIEQSAQEAGAANSIRTLERQYKKEKELEKKALRDRQQAQKVQQNINDLATLSEIGLAVAKIFASESKLGVVGVVSAIAGVATMLGSIVASRLQARKSIQGFADGTEYVEGRGYADGVDTVPAMVNKGERIIPTKENRKIPRNIKNKDLPTLIDAGIMYMNAMQGSMVTSNYINDFSKLENIQRNTLDEQKRTNTLLNKFMFISGDGKTIIDINGNKRQYV